MSEEQKDSKKIQVELKGRDFFEIEFQGEKILHSKVIGCHLFLQAARDYLRTQLSNWQAPETNDHVAVLMRELVQKARGKWEFPYREAEICHCRAIPTEVVDSAIVAGAHTPEQVSRQTQASTACGTCKVDVEKIISYRIRK